MNPAKRIKTTYWIFTLLAMMPLLASGLAFCAAPASVVEAMTHLGYPSYLIRFLGAAKVLGALAILTGIFPRLKEWAYAGFVFNLLGAAYSHLESGDGPKALGPLVVLGLVLLSYFCWNRVKCGDATSAPAPVDV